MAKVLIVDDDSAAREFIERALSGDGHQVLGACDGLEAWSLFESDGAVDLVLSDISMPGMDGVALATKILDASPTVKVILMTGLDAQLERVDDLSGRGVVTLTKPFSLEDVRALVKGG